MDDCLLYNITEYIDDTTFLKSISLVSNNIYFKKRRTTILKSYGKIYTKYVFESLISYSELKHRIYLNRRQSAHEIIEKYYIELFKEIAESLLTYYNLTNCISSGHQHFPKIKPDFSIHQNLQYMNSLRNKKNDILIILYEHESRITEDKYISSVYRMSRYNTTVLKTYFPNVEALIY